MLDFHTTVFSSLLFFEREKKSIDGVYFVNQEVFMCDYLKSFSTTF